MVVKFKQIPIWNDSYGQHVFVKVKKLHYVALNLIVSRSCQRQEWCIEKASQSRNVSKVRSEILAPDNK